MPTYKLYLVYCCGIHSILLAGFHCLFWQLFHWKKELKFLNSLNCAIMQILNLRLIYVFLVLGLACFIFPAELAGTVPGRFVLFATAIFWIGRLIEQVVFIRTMHLFNYLITLVFMLGAVLFFAAAW